MEQWIGKWVARYAPFSYRNLTQAHLIESVVNEKLLTACGKYLSAEIKKPSIFLEDSNRCKTCS